MMAVIPNRNFKKKLKKRDDGFGITAVMAVIPVWGACNYKFAYHLHIPFVWSYEI